MTDKIKALLALFILCFGVLSFFGSIILFIEGYSKLVKIKDKYQASILTVKEYRSRGMTHGFNEVIGEINGEEKFLLVADSVISNQSPKSFLVFAAKGKTKTYHRREGELELDKTPFKKRATFCFIFPFIINPLLYFLWKILTKNLE